VLYACMSTPNRSEISQSYDFRLLVLLRLFGHLRRAEIAHALWPRSRPAGAAFSKACRSVNRLLRRGDVIERKNALGGTSIILSGRGAAWLRAEGYSAQAGTNITSVRGAHMFHRTLGSSYLIERAVGGCKVFGEHAIYSGIAPATSGELQARFGRRPDGLVMRPCCFEGPSGVVRVVDWVEVEAAKKGADQLRGLFHVVCDSGYLTEAQTHWIDRLVFVFDQDQRHERAILRALKTFLSERWAKGLPISVYFLTSIVFARCHIERPLKWCGVRHVSAADLLCQPLSRPDGAREFTTTELLPEDCRWPV
jgi:hypothetical protein